MKIARTSSFVSGTNAFATLGAQFWAMSSSFSGPIPTSVRVFGSPNTSKKNSAVFRMASFPISRSSSPALRQFAQMADHPFAEMDLRRDIVRKILHSVSFSLNTTNSCSSFLDDIQGSQSEPLRRVRFAWKAASSSPHACAL